MPRKKQIFASALIIGQNASTIPWGRIAAQGQDINDWERPRTMATANEPKTAAGLSPKLTIKLPLTVSRLQAVEKGQTTLKKIPPHFNPKKLTAPIRHPRVLYKVTSAVGGGGDPPS